MKPTAKLVPVFNFWSKLFFAVTLSFFVGVSQPLRAQVVTFPDPSFEQGIRDALNKQSGSILVSDMITLTNLGIPYRGITNLSGLEKATNLLTLDIGGNQLTNISPVTNLTKLYQLQTGYNYTPVDVSPLGKMTNLAYLDISGIMCSNISVVTNLKHLTNLYVGSNPLTNLVPVTKLTNLTTFTFQFDQVLDPSPVAGLTNLVYLDAGGNYAYQQYISISNYSFVTALKKLQWLSLYNLQGTNFTPLAGLTALTNLNIAYIYNVTNGTPLNGLTNMVQLYLPSTGISNLAFASHMPNLQQIDIGSDSVTSLAPLLGKNLNALWAGNNPLTDIYDVTNFPSLYLLHLESMGLKSVKFMEVLTNLTEISISYNSVTSIRPLDALPLNQLFVNGNLLTDIGTLNDLGNLYNVDVSQNLLNTNADSAAWNVITNLQNRYVNVTYDPQSITTNVVIYDSPQSLCLTNGANAYFAVAAADTDPYTSISFQWLFNDEPILNQTNNVLQIFNVTTNQAGAYRAIVTDNNNYGSIASDPAALYVGDPYCGQTVFITQQPVNVCAAPGESVDLVAQAYTTLTNMNVYYQWQFNGTNIDDAIYNDLYFDQIDPTNAGFYSVLVWDDNSNYVSSAVVQLKVVNNVTFADANLSTLIHQQLSLAPGSPVPLTNLDNMNYLYVNNQNISNLSGLECARNLYSVDFSYNPITNATPLGWITTLSYLNLDHCQLQDAGFITNLYNLYDLNLRNDTIHALPPTDNLTNLHYLDISYNGPLINIPNLAKLTNLYNLSIHSDQIGDIQMVNGMYQLQTLDAGGDGIYDNNRNFITDISPLIGKTNITWLSFTWDSVTNLNAILPAFTNITDLYLSGNPFKSITFINGMTNLQNFSIDYSQVTNLAPVASHYPLNYLEVSYTGATNINAVAGLTNLTAFYASGNNAGSLTPIAAFRKLSYFGWESNNAADMSVFAPMTNLSYLDLANNRFTNLSVFSNKYTIYNMNLSGNLLHDLTPLTGLTNISGLNVSANGITDITPLSALYQLNYLSMQSNNVQNIAAVAGLTNLQYYLDISANLITNLSPITNLHLLGGMSVSQNKLSTLPLMVGLPFINYLDLRFNQITNLSGLSGMPQLNNLGLSFNNMTVLPTLPTLPNLQSLDLTSNQLVNISGISGATALLYVYASGNNLQSIHPMLSLTNLNYTDLRFNWLDTNTYSAAWSDITNLQHHAYVNYDPQNFVRLSNPVFTLPHTFQFNIQSAAGLAYGIYYTTNSSLSAVRTGTLLRNITNATGNDVFTDTTATGTQRFYQAVGR